LLLLLLLLLVMHRRLPKARAHLQGPACNQEHAPRMRQLASERCCLLCAFHPNWQPLLPPLLLLLLLVMHWRLPTARAHLHGPARHQEHAPRMRQLAVVCCACCAQTGGKVVPTQYTGLQLQE
jgi:hypothetical protein